MSCLARWLLLGLLVLLGGCSSLRPWQNLPMQPRPATLGSAESPPANQQRAMLMLLSLSGGGARAAAFGYGVLDALRQTEVLWQGRKKTLIDELDVISGVSGGSIIAAYYAAFGSATFPAFEEHFLRQNFQDSLVSNMFQPGNLVDLSSPWFGRSHLLERRLAELYHGKTFADLPSQPRLLVSATDLSLGSSFEFTWRQFRLICSDLASVPLSFAVSASSAVPIALSPMTLKNYSSDCPRPARLVNSEAPDYRVRLLQGSQRSYLDGQARPYIHLVDGGLADNLGLRSLLDRAQADGGLRQALRGESPGKVQRLVIVAVNAERDPSEQIDATDQVPGTWSVVDALLFGTGARATQETLGLLSDTVQTWRRELSGQAQEDDPFAPDAQIHVINVNLRDAPEPLARRRLLQIPTAFSVPPDDVDNLIQAGRSILLASPDYQALVKSLQPPAHASAVSLE